MKREFVLVAVFLIIISNISYSLALSEYELSYDSDGNLIQRFNKLKVIREDSLSGRIIEEYSYDPEGNRIKKIEFNSDGTNTTTYYIGKDFIQIVNSSGVFNETYYSDEENLIAKKDKNAELYYYGARYYDSFSKHFIQPDSAIADVYNPQDLNRYSYTRNNPYKYTDPTGETP